MKFADFGEKANALFSENHEAGLIKANKSGPFGAGSYNIELERNVNDTNLAVKSTFEADGYTATFENSTMTFAFDCGVKQLDGLSLSFNPTFNALEGMGLGNLGVNFANSKVNLGLKSTLSATPLLNFDATIACNKCEANLGVQGEFDAKSSNLNNMTVGFHKNVGDLELSFVADDYKSPFCGTFSVYKALKEGPFCCYGVQGNGPAGKLSVAWAQKCCSNLLKYKIDETGTFSVANSKKLNGAVTMNVAAALNLGNLNAGGHNFGVGLSFN